MQLFLLCLIAAGAIIAKLHIMDEHNSSFISNLVLNVLLPCNILSSFFDTSRSQLASMGIIFTISVGILALSFLLSLVLYKRVRPEQKKVLIFATFVSNAAYLGNPIVESIYGLEGLPYVAAYLVPLRIAIWTLGIAVFSAGEKGMVKKIVFNPCLIASYLGFLVMLTGFTPPLLVYRLVFSLGNCTIPLAMLVVGGILSMVDPRKLLTKLTVYFTFIRLILIPLLVMGFFLIYRTDPMISGVSVILSGMPAAVLCTVFAEKYRGDGKLASRIVFVSTLLSIITAPLLAWLLQRIL